MCCWAHRSAADTTAVNTAPADTLTTSCCRWLAKDEDDGAIRRRLKLLGAGDSSGSTTYRVTTHTSDVRGAGTDANVHIQLLGCLPDGRQVGGL